MHARIFHRCQPAFRLGIFLTLLFALASTALAQDPGARTQEFDAAREMLRAGQYRDAARAFERIERAAPDDDISARSLYWRAFALQREGGRNNLREAAEVLERQFERFPDTARGGDSAELAVQIQGDLAKLGDARAAERIAALADEIRARGERQNGNGSGESETRIAALNALMHMSPEKAVPILRKILQEKPEGYSEELREKAVFIVSQHGDHDANTTLELLTHVIANDPSASVREQAVFWLSQTDDPRSIGVLTDLLRRDGETPEIREKAIFALAQIGGPAARETLRTVALDRDQPTELREHAVFWISQSGDEDALEVLVELYRGADSPELRDRTLFAVSQIDGSGSAEFLLSVVRDREQNVENRKQALFWLGQNSEIDVDAVLEIFDTTDDVEMQEQAIFVLSQLETSRSVEALIEIAREQSNQDLREKAIFWLGQSDDERAADFLAALLEEEF